MGKAKRINDRHANEGQNTPVVAKKNKWLTPVIAAVVALVVVACLVLTAVQSSGAILRSKKPFVTDHVTITGSMFQYQYMSYYNYYCSQVDSSMQQYLEYLQNYYLSTAISSAATECGIYAVYGEAAHRAGIKLDDDDKDSVDAYMANLEAAATYYGYSTLSAYLTAMFGEGVKAKDVKAMYELNLLCSKYETQLSEELEDAMTEDEVLQYYEKNADSFITASYLGYSFKATMATVNSADYATTEEYNAALEAAQQQYTLDKLDVDVKAEALTHAVSAADFTAMLAVDGLTPTEGTDVVKSNLSNDEVKEWIFTEKAAVNATKAFGADTGSEYTAVAYIITKSASRDETLTKNIQYIANTNDVLTDEIAAQFLTEFKADPENMTREHMLLLATTHNLTDAMKYVENAPVDAFNMDEVTAWLSSDEAVPGAISVISGTVGDNNYNVILFVDSNGDAAWKVDAKEQCLSAKLDEWMTAKTTEFNVKTDLSYWTSDDE